MCVSNLPSKFSNTKIFVSKVKDNHLLAYQMDFEQVGNDTGRRMMILQVPATEIVALHDTTNYNGFLNDIYGQTSTYEYSYINGISKKPAALDRGLLTSKSITSHRVGMYEVLIVPSADELANLSRYVESDVPEISPEMIEFYKHYYGGFIFLCVLFEKTRSMSAQPFMVEYQGHPLYISDNGVDYEGLYVPAVDNETQGVHRGVPNLEQKVERNHLIAFPAPNGLPIEYTQEVPEFLRFPMGFYRKEDYTQNGDFVIANRRIQVLPPSRYESNPPSSWAATVGEPSKKFNPHLG